MFYMGFHGTRLYTSEKLEKRNTGRAFPDLCFTGSNVVKLAKKFGT
jgi:hypothetical protein